MAKVVSLFKISGTIGDLTFRETASGTVAQRKPGPSREQALTHESFDLTRRNAGEFKLAVKDAALLRLALGSVITGVWHSLLNGMMNGLLYAAAMRDKRHEYGSRYAGAGDVSRLAGFDFNPNLLLDHALPIKFQHSLDVAAGILQLKVPIFLLRRKKGFPKEATHFRIVSCGAVVDFRQAYYRNDIKASEFLPLGQKTLVEICLEHRLKAGPGEVLLQVMGIEFYKIVNAEMELLKFGAMRILKAERQQGIEALRQRGGKRKLYTAKDLR